MFAIITLLREKTNCGFVMNPEIFVVWLRQSSRSKIFQEVFVVSYKTSCIYTGRQGVNI